MVKLFGLETEHLRQDYLVHYCIWLSELQVNKTCDTIRNELLNAVRDNRFAYRAYFTEQNIDAWKRAKQSQKDIQTLENIPNHVNTIYDILETLSTVSKTFSDLESIDISDKTSTLTIITNAVTILTTDFPLVYDRLQNLNHSSTGIELILTPLLDQLSALANTSTDLKNKTFALKDKAYQENKEAITLLLPEHSNGLAFFGRAITLSSFVLKELTELIERGDLKIDFDPTSREILTLERRFKRELKNIQDSSALLTGLGPMGRLAKLLYGEISKILNESIPLTEAAHNRAQNAFQSLQDDILAQYRVEVEQFEASLGLEPGVLTQPFEKERQRFLSILNQYLVKQLAALPAKTRELQQLSDQPVTTLAGSAMNAVQSGIHEVRKKINHMLPGAHQRRAAPSRSREEEVSFESEIYTQHVQQERLKQFVQYQGLLEEEQEEQAAHEFFTIINQYNQQYGTKQIQFLPEKVKLTLKSAYLKIQPYFARRYPKMDIDIVSGLNHDDTDQLQPKQAGSSLDRTVIDSVASAAQYAPWIAVAGLALSAVSSSVEPFASSLPTWTNLAARALSSMNLGTISQALLYGVSFGMTATGIVDSYLTNQIDNQLQHILNCQDAVMIEIRQDKANTRFKYQQIVKHFEKELNLSSLALTEHLTHRPDYDEYTNAFREQRINRTQMIAEQLQQPLIALGSQLQYKTLFARLKELKYSEEITQFENTTLFPSLKHALDNTEIESLFGVETDLAELAPKLPFTEFYKDSEHVVVYKKLLNAFYHLKTCLIELEKVDDLGEPAAWNIYGRGKVALDMLVPILTNGLGACFDIVDALKNPLVATLAEQGLSKLKSLDVLFPMISQFATQTIAQDRPIDMPFNAKLAWLNEQIKYEGMVNKHVVPSPVIAAATVVNIETVQNDASDKQSNAMTVESFAKWLSISTNRFKQSHERLVARDDTPLDEENINTDAMRTTDEFFKQLSRRVHQHLYKNDPALQNKSEQIIQQFRTLCLEAETNAPLQNNTNTSGLWTLFDDIKTALVLIDQISAVLKDTHLEHAQDVLDQIKFLHDIIGFKLLTLTADIECLLGLKTGILSTLASQYVDTAFETLIRQYSSDSQYLFQFWADHTLLNLRVHHERRQLRASRITALTENSRISREALESIMALDDLENSFPTDASIDFKTMPEFEDFCHHYEILQPILFQCDPKFDQSSFLKSIHNHRPDLVISAIKQILKDTDKIDQLFASKNKHKEHNVDVRLKRIAQMDNVERKQREQMVVKKAIHQILSDEYAPVLGRYLPLLIETIEQPILQALLDTQLYPLLQDHLNGQDEFGAPLTPKEAANAFHLALRNYVGSFVNFNQLTFKRLFDTLFKLNQFEERFRIQNEQELTKTDKEQNDYSFHLKPTDPQFVAEEYKLYFDYEETGLFYTVLNPQGEPIRRLIEPQFLTDNSIDLTAGFNQEVIEKQLMPKASIILKMTTAQSDTEAKNPCSAEKIAYLQGLKTSDNRLDTLKTIFEETPEVHNSNDFYHALYSNEIRRVRLLWNYREKKLHKYDQLITAFEALNDIESHCKQHPSAENNRKIILVRSLKSILKSTELTPQHRLNLLSLRLADDTNRMILAHEPKLSILEWLISPFMRWKRKESDLLSRLYTPMWPGVKLLLSLNEMETHLLHSQSDVNALNWDKLNEIRALKTILQQLDKSHTQIMNEFIERLSTTVCLDTLSKHSDESFIHSVKNMIIKTVGFASKEDQLLESICLPMNDFFEVNRLLNQMQHYAGDKTLVQNQRKLVEIKRLKEIMEGLGSQEARLQHLSKELSKIECKTILSTSSDLFLIQLTKQLFSYLTGWKREEEQLFSQLNAKLCFFKPAQTLAETVIQAANINHTESSSDTTENSL